MKNYLGELEKLAQQYFPGVRVKFDHRFRNFGGKINHRKRLIRLNPYVMGKELLWILLHEIGHHKTFGYLCYYRGGSYHPDKVEKNASAWADREMEKLRQNGLIK